MTMKTLLLSALLPLSFAPRVQAQSLDAALDGAADALAVPDAGGDAASTGADAGAGHDAGAPRDAATPPPVAFFFKEHPGCSVGGAPAAPGLALGAALVAVALFRRRARKLRGGPPVPRKPGP
jgi:MYXO-CTERM domain-containing protein